MDPNSRTRSPFPSSHHSTSLMPHRAEHQLPALSGGTITSDHIRWVSELRAAKGRWSSEVHGTWSPAENDYFEFTYELFHAGLLGRIEVGLPVRYFMSELLGCSVQRIDLKLIDDKRIGDLSCPAMPQRELGDFEYRGLSNKLIRLERAFLSREVGPLHNRVRYNSPEDAPRFQHVPARAALITQNSANPLRHPLDQPRSSSNSLQAAYPSRPGLPQAGRVAPPLSGVLNFSAAQPPAAAPVGLAGSVPQRNAFGQPQFYPNGRHAGVVEAVATATATASSTGNLSSIAPAGALPAPATSGLPSMAPAGGTAAPAAAAVPAAATVPAAAAAPAALAAAGSARFSAASVAAAMEAQTPELTLAPTTSFVDPAGKRHPYTPGTVLQQKLGQESPAPPAGPPAPAPPSAPPPRTAAATKAKISPAAMMAGGHGAVRPSAGERSEGKELGQKLLGVARKESPGGEQQQPAQKRRAGGGGGHPDAGLSSSSPAVGSSMNARELWAGIEAHEDEAAMEYLKWELHGKFMAFPGEHYHSLLSILAAEIYHNRYPVEHGVDVLHGVMRDAGPAAVEKCAATLKKMNPPSKMML